MFPADRSPMRSHLRKAIGLLSFSAVFACSPLWGMAEQGIADKQPAAHVVAAENEALETGRKLEQERRWQESIIQYEKFLKKTPSYQESCDRVKTRLQACRVHHDVNRRYADRSFLQTLDSASATETLQVFNEVIAKLEVYYVERIDYYRLALHGTAFLEVALTEPDFLGKHLRNADRDAVEQFRQNIHLSVFGRRITNAEELKATATMVAKMASDQIGLPINAVLYEYIAGSIGLLDPYSALLTPGEYREVMSSIEGNLIGLGVELRPEGSALRIENVFRGGPAYTAGLAPNQHIVKVDGQVVAEIGATRAADMLRGPEGSQVALQLQTVDERLIDVRVERRRVEVPSVSISEIAEPGIGYIRITNFQKTTPAELSKSMYELSNKGMRSLVIDLRKNPGGLLDAAVEMADLFLHNGTIVSTKGRNGLENQNFTAKSPGTWDIPLVVLIDEDSASASEIFAGAMHDHSRATIVGQTSYGKGSVQGVFHNEKGNGGMRLTVSKFYSPDGTPISANGIHPNVPVEIAQSETPNTLDRIAMKPASDGMRADGTRMVSTQVQVDITKVRGVEMARKKIQLGR